MTPRQVAALAWDRLRPRGDREARIRAWERAIQRACATGELEARAHELPSGRREWDVPAGAAHAWEPRGPGRPAGRR